MLNITDTPPTNITFGSVAYDINYDFLTWIWVSETLKQIDFEVGLTEDDIKIITDITVMVFGYIIPVDMPIVLSEILVFLRGYPEVDNGYHETSNNAVYSFKHDLNYIILAIRNQSGIDLSYRRKEKFHWWEFLLEFQTLEEHHKISKIISYRSYSGKDKDYIKLKNAYALPKELTKKEQNILNEVDELFYNS